MSVDPLLDRAFDEGLSPAEEADLAGRAASDPAVARALLARARDEAMLAEAVVEARAGRAFAPPPPAPRQRWRLPAALGVALLLLLLSWPRGSGGDARVEAADGVPGLAAGDSVSPGRELSVEGSLHLSLPGGARVLLVGPARGRYEGPGRFRLEAGALEAGGPVRVATPHAEASGTRVAVSTDEVSSFVDSREGTAVLVRGAERVQVPVRHYAEAFPGRPLSVQPLPQPLPEAAPDPGSGRGLRADYFDHDDLSNRRLTRIDPRVDFDYGHGSPHPSIEPDSFSIRWSGQVEPPHDGPLTFHVLSDDGCRLWIDGRIAIDDWTVRGTRERSATIDARAGRRLDLRLEYFDRVSTARVSLLWSGPSLPRQIVPADRLYPGPSGDHLLDETFPGGAPSPGPWEATPAGAIHEPGYLLLPASEAAPSLVAAQAHARKAGLCLAVGYLGNVHRGNGPFLGFEGGPGWMPAQRQGRFLNTALPVGAPGDRGYAVRNDNLDTLFAVVLRERGAFHLVSEDGRRARLVRVSHTGDASPLRPLLRGGRANARFSSVLLTDLGGDWASPWGPASLVDRFERRDPRWETTGDWTLGDGGARTSGTGSLLSYDAGTSEGHWEVTVLPGEGARRAALLVRGTPQGDHGRFEIDARGTRFIVRRGGRDEELAPTAWRERRLEAGRPVRLGVRAEGPWVDLYVDDVPACYGPDFPAFESAGTRVGLLADGPAEFRDFAAWPAMLDLPPALQGRLPPVERRAEGEILVHDDFEGPDGPLEGRMPRIGRKPWTAGRGAWRVEGGAAVPGAVPGWVRLDGVPLDAEISATIQLPPGEPPWPKDWFPAVQARASGPGPIESAGGINARFLWQNGSNEIEVWDRPPDTPEQRARWAARTGPHAGRLLTELLNATNITPRLRPAQTHVLRVSVRGNRVSYFCDDELVGSGATRVASGTWAGLNVDAEGDARVRFLDFTVRSFRR